MKIKDLKEEHPAIYDLALKRQKEAGNGPNDHIKLTLITVDGGFNWGDTEEGYEFWEDIYNGKFQTFYGRYPEYAKDPVKFSVEEKDWSKATDEELIAETEKYIGKVAVCLEDGEAYNVKAFSEILNYSYSCGPAVWVHTDHINEACIFNGNKWAEIISQPKEASPEAKKDFEANNPRMDFSNDVSDSVAYITHSIPPEPKVGDMVECSNDKFYTVFFDRLFTGWKTRKGNYAVEGSDGLEEYSEIRLPHKSEVESKAESIMKEAFKDSKRLIFTRDIFKIVVETAIKWGQQNPTKK